MLRERGRIEQLPETVQGMIAARLDLLEPEQKSLVQDAAVVGKTFWLGALAQLTALEQGPLEQLLHALERREFVRRERSSSVAGDVEYAFRHLLVRDVAYAQIPRAERADRHRRAAEWIGGLGRPEDHSEMLSHHYRHAFELAELAGLDTAGFAAAGRRRSPPPAIAPSGSTRTTPRSATIRQRWSCCLPAIGSAGACLLGWVGRSSSARTSTSLSWKTVWPSCALQATPEPRPTSNAPSPSTSGCRVSAIELSGTSAPRCNWSTCCQPRRRRGTRSPWRRGSGCSPRITTRRFGSAARRSRWQRTSVSTTSARLP